MNLQMIEQSPLVLGAGEFQRNAALAQRLCQLVCQAKSEDGASLPRTIQSVSSRRLIVFLYAKSIHPRQPLCWTEASD